MPIKVACQCGQSFAAKDELAGKTVKCPKCAAPITIPRPKAAAPQRPANRSAAQAPKPTPAPAPSGLADLLSEEGFAGHAGTRCVSCNTPLPAGAVVCTQCGFNAQTGQRTTSNVRFRTPGHGEAAEEILSRAAKEIAATPIQMKSNDFGDAKSVWTWVMLPFLPMLMALGFGVVILWGVMLAAPVAAMFNALMAGQYELLIPGLLGLVGLFLMMVGWFGVSTAALESNVWQGIVSLITLGLYTPIYGTAHYRTCKYPMEMFWYGAWSLNLGILALYGIGACYIKAPLLILPIVMYGASAFLTWFGTYRVTLTAFDDRALFGYLSMFVPFYVFIYGGSHWAKCKKDMILAIIGLGLLIVTVVVFVVLFFVSSAIKIPEFQQMFPPPPPA